MRPVKTADYLSWITVAILVLLPFHAFLTVWSSRILGHYTLIRLWKEFLLAILLTGSLYMLVKDKGLRSRFLDSTLNKLIGAYCLIILAWGLGALASHNVTGKAMWYGVLVNLRFLVFYLAVWVIASKSKILGENWRKILFGPAIIVAAFAILQYLVLPYDFLKHFGYGPHTISAYETINHDIHHIRVASTLRGANPLGAYLILPITAAAVLAFREKRRRQDLLMIGVGLILALIFSFSRSAWIGVVIALVLITWLLIKNEKTKRMLALAILGTAILGIVVAMVFRNNTTAENVLLHTDHTSKISESSNEGHSAAFKSAAKDILHEPWGRGIGTAGPESTYNYGHHGRISENYFLQIGQEAGLVGTAFFIAMCALVGRILWDKRTESLALILFASLIGISLVNLLSHAWTDDTLAYLWWGFAAIALAPSLVKTKH